MQESQARGRRELSVTRLIDAPRALVFRAWTDAEGLAHWWGPPGVTTIVYEMDLRPGGVFNTVMRDEAGDEYPASFVFLAIVENERIVFTDAFARDWRPSARASMVAEVSFKDAAGRTRVTFTARLWPATDGGEHEPMGSTAAKARAPIAFPNPFPQVAAAKRLRSN